MKHKVYREYTTGPHQLFHFNGQKTPSSICHSKPTADRRQRSLVRIPCRLTTVILATWVCLIVSIQPAFAMDVTLAWDPSTSTIDGYRIYYKTGDQGGSPYDGTEAIEGGSPVTVGNVTQFTLRNLTPGQTYYFVVTAYLGSLESGFSNEVCLYGTAPVLNRKPVNMQPILTLLLNDDDQ